MGKESRFSSVQSMLFAILTSGKYWRCIRWCDNGTTVLITSPKLFEREVLKREMKGLNLKNFASFVKMLKTVGFQQVLSARASKTQKFRHPCFQINRKEVSNDKTGKEKEETRRGRKGQMIVTESKCLKKNYETPQKIKRRGKEPTEDFSGRIAVKRKRDTTESTDDDLFANAKRKKLNTSVSTANQNPPPQRMTGHSNEITAAQALLGLSTGEITAAQALLGLSTGVVFVQNIPMNLRDLMSVQGLIDSSKSLVLFAERSAREIETAQALLELTTANITR
ncbi:uncharacterized protein LOC144640806 [Oculina patagonica]